MHPGRRNLSQRTHYETTVVSARVWQSEIRLISNRLPVRDQVKIQGARAVGRATVAAKRHLQSQQAIKGFSWTKPRLDKDNAVEIVRKRRIGPGC